METFGAPPVLYMWYACWNAYAANDLSPVSERAVDSVFKSLKRSIRKLVGVLLRCRAWWVFFPCPAITLHHGHSCCVAADLSPRNMILFIIWPSFGRRQPATPDPWFTPVCVYVCFTEIDLRGRTVWGSGLSLEGLKESHDVWLDVVLTTLPSFWPAKGLGTSSWWQQNRNVGRL